MLPVGGRPVIQWSLSYLLKQGYRRVIIGTNPEDERLRRFVHQAFSSNLDLHFVKVQSERGPGGTLLECLEHEACPQMVTVVLGDTLFQFPEEQKWSPSANYVLTADDASDATRWCYASVNENFKVNGLKDKPESRPDHWPILIGVYHVSEISIGKEALVFVDEPEPLEIRHFLQPYIEQGILQSYPAEEWSDCGNMDLLLGARRRMLVAREFNSLDLDEVRGTICKRSRHTVKLVNEINYYRLLPSDLQCFFPRLVDFSIAAKNAYLTLEYYGYPTLSELWVFEEYDMSTWRRIFQRLREVTHCFSAYEMSLTSEEVDRFYWDKTTERIQAFENQSPDFCELVSMPTLSINGKRRNGWPEIQHWVRDRVSNIARTCRPCIIHGDLCFSNILYDPFSQALKLIDVRGSFGSFGLYGDPRYDAAKLLHSIHGGYDFLIHDMFSCERSGEHLRIEQYFPKSRQGILNAFQECFSADHAMEEIRFLEGLLFITMCPLHNDHPDRQTAMFAIGLELLNRIQNNEDMY